MFFLSLHGPVSSRPALTIAHHLLATFVFHLSYLSFRLVPHGESCLTVQATDHHPQSLNMRQWKLKRLRLQCSGVARINLMTAQARPCQSMHLDNRNASNADKDSNVHLSAYLPPTVQAANCHVQWELQKNGLTGCHLAHSVHACGMR